jgi:hypothetical protein
MFILAAVADCSRVGSIAWPESASGSVIMPTVPIFRWDDKVS